MFLESMSNREKAIWANLLLDVIIAFYFFPKVITFEAGIQVITTELTSAIGGVIVIAIIGSSLIYWLLDVGKAEQKDERDYQFEAKSSHIGYWVLFIAIWILIGQLLLQGLTERLFGFQYEDLTLNHLVVFLILILTVAEILKDTMRLFYYRRGY